MSRPKRLNVYVRVPATAETTTEPVMQYVAEVTSTIFATVAYNSLYYN